MSLLDLEWVDVRNTYLRYFWCLQCNANRSTLAPEQSKFQAETPFDMNETKHFVLAQDADLESLRDGAPQIYWSEPKSVQGARWLQTMVSVVSVSASGSSFSVDVVAQYSFDGRSWIDFGRSLIDGDDSGGVATTGNHREAYAGDSNVEFAAPFVRFGIVVGGETGSPGTQQVIRLTAVVAVMYSLDSIMNRPLSGAAGFMFLSSQSPGVVDNSVFTATPAREGYIGVSVSSMVASVSNLKLQGSADRSNWFDVATIAASVTDGYHTAYVSNWLPRYLRLIYTSDGSGSGTIDNVDLMLRS